MAADANVRELLLRNVGRCVRLHLRDGRALALQVLSP
jgi:hypothetical protein